MQEAIVTEPVCATLFLMDSKWIEVAKVAQRDQRTKGLSFFSSFCRFHIDWRILEIKESTFGNSEILYWYSRNLFFVFRLSCHPQGGLTPERIPLQNVTHLHQTSQYIQSNGGGGPDRYLRPSAATPTSLKNHQLPNGGQTTASTASIEHGSKFCPFFMY